MQHEGHGIQQVSVLRGRLGDRKGLIASEEVVVMAVVVVVVFFWKIGGDRLALELLRRGQDVVLGGGCRHI